MKIANRAFFLSVLKSSYNNKQSNYRYWYVGMFWKYNRYKFLCKQISKFLSEKLLTHLLYNSLTRLCVAAEACEGGNGGADYGVRLPSGRRAPGHPHQQEQGCS